MSGRDMYIKQLEEKLIHVVRGTGRTTVCMSVLDLAIIVNLLKEQPEIVRCKNCIHWDDDDCEIGNNLQMFADDWCCPCGEVKQE